MRKPYLLIVGSICLLALTACGEEDKGVVTGEGSYNIPMLEGGKDKYKDAEHGQEAWFAMGAMSGVDGVNANGVAQSNRYEDGIYRHAVQLNVERTEDGYFYEGWIMNEEIEEAVSTGHMHSRFGDVRHFLNFEAETDLTEYSKVLVTLEADDGNPSPGKTVAEGILKTRKR